MPIPAFDANGLLPPGIHHCTLEEIASGFGQFRTTSQRPELFARLREYVQEAKNTHAVKALVIDGSFVTTADVPNDVDMIVVLDAAYDFRAEVRPFQYNLLSRRRVQRRFRFDILVARENSAEYAEYIAFFEQVRGAPDLRKGLLRLDL